MAHLSKFSTSKSNFSVDFDASEFLRDVSKYAELTSKELLSVFNRSLSRASTQTIVKEARKDLKSYLGFSEDSTGATAKSLGVKSAKKKPLVLLGGRVSGNHNGQLVHILDQGTTDRTTKSGASRGKVIGLQFYLNAMNSKNGDLERKFNNYLKENYLKRIMKQVK